MADDGTVALTESAVQTLCETLGVPLLPGDLALVAEIFNGQLARLNRLESAGSDVLDWTDPFPGFEVNE